jgi:BNR repeat-like domain
MPYTTLEQGFVTQGCIAVGPRTAVAPNGDILCSAMLTSALGTNDFLPVLYRSVDGGKSWTEQGPIWPHLQGHWSIFTSISRAAGRMFLCGSRTPIDKAGEPFWSDATQGLKQNELIWAQSTDSGRTWTEPAVIPMPIPGAAEAPGALCCMRHGRWLVPYSPYNTFDPTVSVQRNQVLVVYTDDQGGTWNHAAMLRFDDARSGGAEAWVVELSDGRLLGTAWHLGHGGAEHPNAFALSHDGGTTWQPTRSTGILGQSTALAPLPGDRALFIYNQRKHGEPGVWLAVVRPTDTDFGVETNEIVWRAETRTQKGTSGEHDEWSDFSFGEPSVTPVPDGTLLVALWCIQPTGRGIRYVKLRRTP